jgi:hypothetical protein
VRRPPAQHGAGFGNAAFDAILSALLDS